MPESIFAVSSSWRERYPDAAVGVLALANVTNPARHDELDRHKIALEADLRQRHAGLSRPELKALPELRAYLDYYRPFKKTYHVQQQLETVVLKDRSIPRVAALVEAMFMAELDSLLLTAGHDLDHLKLPATIRVAAGEEHYVRLTGRKQQLKAGDMFIADGEGVLSSILYGPDARSRIRASTRRALFTVYGVPGISPKQLSTQLKKIRQNVQIIAPQAETVLEVVITAA